MMVSQTRSQKSNLDQLEEQNNSVETITEDLSSPGTLAQLDTIDNMGDTSNGGASNADILNAITGMEERLNKRMDGINNCIDNLEASLDEKIKTCVTEEVRKFKDSIDGEISSIRTKVSAIENDRPTTSRGLNIVLTNIEKNEEETMESLKEKVTAVLESFGAQVTILNAERKQSYKENNPGVVIATLSSAEDRRKVLKEKYKLKDSAHYSVVRIYPDLTWEQRKHERNMQTLINSVAGDKLIWRNGHVQRKPEETDTNTQAVQETVNNGMQPNNRGRQRGARGGGQGHRNGQGHGRRGFPRSQGHQRTAAH